MHLRFARLDFGLRPSPEILGAMLSHHINNNCCPDNPGLADQLKRSFYVNDLIKTATNVSIALNLCVQLRQVMAAARMNQNKWNSNLPELV